MSHESEQWHQAFRIRLQQLVARYTSRKTAAKAAGVSADALHRYLKGSNQPPFPAMARLAQNAGVSLDWLAWGQGLENKDNRDWVHIPPLVDCYERGEPLPPSAGSCGVGLTVSRQWLTHGLQVDPDQVASCTVIDDSMAPLLRPGNVLIIDRQLSEEPAFDGIYALSLEGAFLIKHLQRQPEQTICLHSEHPAYHSFEMPVNELNTDDTYLHGRVVWCGRRLA